MHLSADAPICGLPARDIRRLLRSARHQEYFDSEYIREGLRLPKRRAAVLAEALLSDGWIEPARGWDAGAWYKVTLKGRTLALASFAPQLHRRTAERKIADLLDRVHHVNENPYYLYRVTRVLLFGSMLRENPRVSDVDVVIDLVPKIEDKMAASKANRARTEEAEAAGRRFSNMIAEYSWARDEVLLFLKSRSRSLSFHHPDDGILERTEVRQIFPVQTDEPLSATLRPPTAERPAAK